MPNSDDLIDTAGDMIAFGIMGVLGAFAIGVKVWEWGERRRGKAVVIDTQTNGGVKTSWSGTSHTR